MSVPHRFGCFLSPTNPIGEAPTALLARELDLAVRADDLGLDEFWFGEHHSGGWSTIASPELAIAALAHRTRRILLGTGVISAPYHHPFMIAQRASMLSHLTHGRLVVGLGAGALSGDMAMLDVARADTPRRLADAAEVVIDLLRGEAVTRETDWFTLNNGRVHPLPFRGQAPEVTVASAASTSGMELCGRLGIHPLSFGAPPWGTIRPSSTGPGARLRAQWNVFEAAAAAAGHRADRARWRVTFPIHVATSTQTARAEIAQGWLRERTMLWRDTVGLPMSHVEGAGERALAATIEAGELVAGSPEDCAGQIRRLAESSGGFGTLLVMAHNWAGAAAQRRSLDLFATEVVPRLTGEIAWLQTSMCVAKGRADSRPNPGRAPEPQGQHLPDRDRATLGDERPPTPIRETV